MDLQPQKSSLKTLSLTIVDNYCSAGLARSLLQNSAANEAEAFAIFQEELDRCVDSLDKEEILFQSGAGDRKLSK